MNPGRDPEPLHRLRNRVLTALHTGRLKPGDRLPSVRSVAADMEIDPRTVMDLYGRLADDGLVDVRPRSGVYLAKDDSPSAAVSGETVRWVAKEVAAGGWKRRIPLLDLPAFLRTCLHATDLICACIDDIQDERIAICEEIGNDFGMTVREIEPLENGSVRVGGAEMSLDAALSDAHLVVVTAFHERDVRPVANDRGIPLVLSTLNPDGVEEILALKTEHPELVFVVLDPRAEPRLREAYGDGIEVLTVEDYGDGRSGPDHGPLVFTLAAAEAVDELPERALVPRSPCISAETAEALTTCMVRLNLRHAGGQVARQWY